MKAFLLKHYMTMVSIAAITLVFFAGFEGGQERGRAASQKDAIVELHSAQDSLHAMLSIAVDRNMEIAVGKALADSADRRARTAVSRAKVLGDSVPKLKRALDSLLTDSSTKVVADRLVGVLVERNDSLQSALVSRTEENMTLQEQLTKSQTTLKDIIAAATKVDTAATKVVGTLHTPFLARIAPKPGIGLALGVDQTGVPRVIAGVTLSWSR